MATIAAELSDVPPERQRTGLPLGTKVAHGTGAMANGSLIYLRSLLLLFYSQVVGLEAWMVSLALAIVIACDAVWDPAIGHFSDNLRSRWGRRHTLMFAAPVPVAILCAMLWNPPVGLSPGATFAWLLGSALVLNFTFSLYEVPANALTPELAPGYHVRTNLLAWRWVLGTGGAMITAFLGLGWFLSPEAGAVGQLVREGYGRLGIAAALLMLAAMLINAFGTRRYRGSLYEPPASTGGIGKSLKEAVETLRNRNMAVAVMAGALAGIGFGIRTVLEAYIATFIWGLPASALLLTTVAGFVATPIGAIVGAMLSRRHGKKRACMGLFFVGTILTNMPLLLRLSGVFFANGDPLLLPTLVSFAFVSAVFYYGGFVLVSSMIADIVEDAQARTGRRSEGLITSADQFIQKIITAMGTVLGGALLTLIAFPRKALPGQVPAETLAALGWTFLVLVTTLSFLSIAIWKFYRIDREGHEARLSALDVPEVRGAA